MESVFCLLHTRINDYLLTYLLTFSFHYEPRLCLLLLFCARFRSTEQISCCFYNDNKGTFWLMCVKQSLGSLLWYTNYIIMRMHFWVNFSLPCLLTSTTFNLELLAKHEIFHPALVILQLKI